MQIYKNSPSVTGIFQRFPPQAQNSGIKKCILMAVSEDTNLEILLRATIF